MYTIYIRSHNSLQESFRLLFNDDGNKDNKHMLCLRLLADSFKLIRSSVPRQPPKTLHLETNPLSGLSPNAEGAGCHLNAP